MMSGSFVLFKNRRRSNQKKNLVCDHHIYEKVWKPVYGQKLAVQKLTVDEHAKNGEWQWRTILLECLKFL